MQTYYESFQSIKSHTTKKDWGGNEALSRVMGQPSTMLPMEQPHASAASLEKESQPSQPKFD